MALKDYSTTPANNSDAPPNGAPEGMAANLVNNTMRQTMADIKGGVRLLANTNADMTALIKGKLSTNNVIATSGGESIGDGEDGIYYWDASSTATANASTVFAADEGGVGRFIKLSLSDISSIAALKGIPSDMIVNGQTIKVDGYYAPGDILDVISVYAWNDGSTAADDGGGTILPTDSPASGRWILQNPNNVHQFGFVSTGTGTANADALQAHADFLVSGGIGGRINIGPGSFDVADHNADGSILFIDADTAGGTGEPQTYEIVGSGREATKLVSTVTGVSSDIVLRFNAGLPSRSTISIRNLSITSDLDVADPGGGDQNGGTAIQIEDSVGSSVDDVAVVEMQRGIHLFNNKSGRFTEQTHMTNMRINGCKQSVLFSVNAGVGLDSFRGTHLDVEINLFDDQTAIEVIQGNVYDCFLTPSITWRDNCFIVRLGTGAGATSLIHKGFCEIFCERGAGATDNAVWEVTGGTSWMRTSGELKTVNNPLTDFTIPSGNAGDFQKQIDMQWNQPVDIDKSDQGSTDRRLRNAYYSGGVFLGGGNDSLDEYEEGTWTPTLVPTGTDFTSVTYLFQEGLYTRIGRTLILHCKVEIIALTVGPATGNMVVEGFPFTVGNFTGMGQGISRKAGWTTTGPDSTQVAAASTRASLLFDNNTTIGSIAVANVSSTSRVDFTVVVTL